MKINNDYIKNANVDIFGDWINSEYLIKELTNRFNNIEPFEHIILPNFLKQEIADKISEQFPNNLDDYHKYNNPLEIKYAYDNIENMTEDLQNVFYALCSDKIIEVLKKITKKENIEYDPTCHGGGLHMHPNNGRLHMHLDYEKHPLLENRQRYLNIILYLSKDFKREWGGETELWNSNMSKCIVKSPVQFNTALIFKTTEKSWHGMPEPIKCPEGIYRKTLAYYYLIPLENKKDSSKLGTSETGYRNKAVFTKRPEDPYDPLIEKLYKIRPHRRITEKDLVV